MATHTMREDTDKTSDVWATNCYQYLDSPSWLWFASSADATAPQIESAISQKFIIIANPRMFIAFKKLLSLP